MTSEEIINAIENLNDDEIFTIGHQVVESYEDGNYAIRLTDEPYDGIIFVYGKVTFGEEPDENGNMPLSFDYEIIDDQKKEYDKQNFENYIGDLLIQMIIHGIKHNNNVYTGGTE